MIVRHTFTSCSKFALAFIAAPLLCVSGAALAQASWLNIIGDASDVASETVEVNPATAAVDGKKRMINIRVSRSKARLARDGQQFQSYVSWVFVDCAKGTARHRTQTLYADPLWQGPRRTFVYADTDYRPMAFADITPNPNQRIIRAACSIS